jgi:hypothetical protein
MNATLPPTPNGHEPNPAHTYAASCPDCGWSQPCRTLQGAYEASNQHAASCEQKREHDRLRGHRGVQ